MNLRTRLGIEWLLIAIIATGLIAAISFWRGTASFDNLFYDRLSVTGSSRADPKILLVTIDDNSLSALGKWPWDRSVHADLLQKLQDAKPRSIIFDILLSETGEPASDKALAKAMVGPAPIILPLHFASPGNDGRAYDVVPPASAFASAAYKVGQVNVSFDDDGIVRRAALCFRPELGQPSWQHVVELAWRGLKDKPSPAYARLADCDRQLLIRYTPRGSFGEISYSDVIAGNVPAEMIEGRDVIVGATAAGMGDNFPVPGGDGGLLSGAEIMANMLSTMRHDNFIEPLGASTTLFLSLLPLWIVLLCFLRLRPRTGLAISLASILLTLFCSAVLLFANIWFPPGAALLGILLVYPLWGWRRLQAMSDFMESELDALERENELAILPILQVPTTDLVGRQSVALANAIDQLHNLRRFVSDILQDLPDPMLVTNNDGKITMSNRLVDSRVGYSPIGKNFVETMAPRVTQEVQREVTEYFARQDNPEDYDKQEEFVRFLDQDKSTLVLRRSALRNESGKLLGHIHYFTDITGLARAEAEREEVLQLLSHDMRAPQSTIIAMLDGEIDEDAKARIESNARRTMQLAQNFVDIARMAETKFVGEEILLADMIRETADNLWPLAKERGINIDVQDESDSAFILAETDSLSRAISNILDNAIKFSPDNGLIAIIVDRVPDSATLSICFRDQGDGISADILPRLFSRFATDGDQKGRAKGMGLGLTYVAAVIERHNGTIIASNHEEGGGCFTVTLPEAPDVSSWIA